jgi:quercetin dioxygenase-like cupin family protein
MNESAQVSGVQHVYDFSTLDRLPEGPTSAKVAARRLLSGPTLATGKSSTVGAVLTGSSIILTLGTQARGSGANEHTHPNEQFNFILHGTMTGEQNGERIFAPRGSLLHTPGGLVHTGLACPEEDLLFLAMKDTRHGIVGPSVSGKYEGPNYLPGFGTRAHEPMKSTSELRAESGRDPAGEKTRYIYDFERLVDEKPGRTSSAAVASTVNAAGATGGCVSGEMLHIGLMRYAAGAPRVEHVHDNEQFTFVVEGRIVVELAGHRTIVGRHSIVHVPAGLKHAIVAHGDVAALVVTVQDNRHPFAG